MNHPSTAPKDGTIFLAHFGYPQLVSCIWNPVSEKWAIALPQTGMVDGVWDDNYFESEYENENEMRYWHALPEL